MIGNCQAAGVAAALAVLAPDSRVTPLPLVELRRRFPTAEALAAGLAGFDHLFAQPVPPGFLPSGGEAVIEAARARTTLYPTIVFPAFHPDAVYVGDLASLAEARLVRSPLGHFHSAIVLQAYLDGLDEARTVALFREEVFSRLGYLDGWGAAAEELLRAGEAAGLGLERELLRWTRRGCFMHVTNHPKLFVLGDVARRLLEAAGLPAAAVAVDDYLPDELARDVVWPVYGPLAEHLGVAGSSLFKRRAGAGAAPVLYDLPAFVAASFSLYRAEPRERLACPRLEAWRELPERRALFAG